MHFPTQHPRTLEMGIRDNACAEGVLLLHEVESTIPG